MSEKKHISVLPRETLSCAMPWNSGYKRVIDGTVGYGGHSSLILEKNADVELLGIDRDQYALTAAERRLSFAKERIHLVRDSFANMVEAAQKLGWDKVDSILLDIGVSSPQIDEPERGFSYRFNAPLDMRMDQRQKLSAYDVLNGYSEDELCRIFHEYGEIKESKRLAAAIIRRREQHVFETCEDFAMICDEVIGGRNNSRKKRVGPPAPTLPFQAVRIEVNHELDELSNALEAAVRLLGPGGRLTVISFHSLEDRIVKQFFHNMSVSCKCPPGLPVCICGWKPLLRIITKKPLIADAEELRENTRSASAKLRSAERINAEIQPQ